ncbi:hypothetical protein, partial [Enterobacter cloacae]|uniref:hypothetical protein n=1 Tax=Enterobacter cloacae TaxID=550 RepID=UPI00195388D8
VDMSNSSIHRRSLLGAAVLAAASPSRQSVAKPKAIKAVALDGFVIIDPRPVARRAEEFFPGQGARLIET